MSKKDFIALADFIKNSDVKFTDEHLVVLAAFCRAQNYRFMLDRWLGYIRGTNGPNGGRVKGA
jgi:hypothetical protein